MAPNRIMPAASVRRALILLAAIALAATVLAACGSGGGASSSAESEKTADGEILNEVLSRQTAAVAAYDRSLRGLRGGSLAMARVFAAQEQEHVDAILKALWGLGIASEAEPETIESAHPKSEAEFLAFLYELESGTIQAELAAVGRLYSPSLRSLLATTVANQAQHLVVLRHELGAKSVETVPAPFEGGTTPAP